MGSNKLFYGSPNITMDFIWLNPKAASIYTIANTIFMLEKRIKEGKKFPKQIIIDIYCDLEEKESKKITDLLNILIGDVLLEDVAFIINKEELAKKEEIENRSFNNCETICLFSGGVDSTVGIIKSKDKYENITGLFVAHQGGGKINHKVEHLNGLILKPRGIDFEKFIAPAMGQGYSQTRGFLYLLYGGILSVYTKSKRIIVSECGATMYQPKFAPLDTITYTTNPYVLQIAKTIMQIILKQDLEIIIPFEDFTKTEMLQTLSDDTILSKTHSCITGRWNKNCGLCYACITRMIGSVNLGLSLDYFHRNAFGQRDNEHLNSLLNFCFSFLYNKKELDFWSFRSIEHFNKISLFNRVCDDTFLAIYKLKKKDLLHPHYEFILDEYSAKDKKRIELREKMLNSKKMIPDFTKTVKVYNQ